MPKQERLKLQPGKKLRLNSKTAIFPEQKNEFSNAVGITNDRVNTQSQSTSLGNSRFHTLQRQTIAKEIGQVQGNQHLQRAILDVADDKNAVSDQAKVENPNSAAKSENNVLSIANNVQRAPAADTAPDVEEVPAVEKTDEELAAGIMDTQSAILIGWKQALDRFDKVLTSSSDSESRPNFKKVIQSFVADQLTSEIVKLTKVPGTGEAFKLLEQLSAEVKRAEAAGESATLRDFVVQHGDAIARLQQKTFALKDDFVAKVRKTREKMESAERLQQARKGSKRKSAEVTMASTRESDEYGMMRMMLVETLEKMDSILNSSTVENLYRKLSEEWIRQSKVRGGMGYKFQAVVIIRLKKDYSMMNAHIQGSGGQKIAEQMLKDSPNGVDVFNLKTPRRILVYADNGWPSVILNLNENNTNTNAGSFAEGQPKDIRNLENYVLTRGLPPAKELTGD